ncbi:MAG: LysM peptidoglycan-binding domain-containing protein [Steroidobacteraceae bacterium]
MLSKQVLSVAPAPLLAASLAALLGLGGCSMLGSKDEAASRPVASSPRESEPAAPSEAPMTVTEAAVQKQPEDTPAAPAPAPQPVALNPSAPTSYTVKRGDTLWDIASMFLRDPWLWPEIWQVNPQVRNPHLIYPGDVLTLAYGADGRPAISLTRGGGARLDPMLRSSELDGAIATIPYSAIAAFLERPSVLTKEQIKAAPRLIAFRDKHMAGGSGMEAYVRGLKGGTVNNRYAVVRVGEPIRDPDDKKVLGYQGIYSATAVLLAPGESAKVALTDSARETLEGDRLLSNETDVPLNFVPRAPSRDVRGRIISVVDGVELIGQYKVVAINRGARHGLEPGHVLAIEEAGDIVHDRTNASSSSVRASRAFAPKVKLPNERNGTLLVFRVFDRMSYGLIVGASSPIRVADVVRTP